MAIKKIELENFTVFEKAIIEFCEGVNVFIGENGTGKTHLLKVIYAFCQSKIDDDMSTNVVDTDDFVKNMKNYFKVSTPQLRRVNCDSSEIIITTDNAEYRFTNYGIATGRTANISKEVTPTVFIPAKEMLTHSGLEKDYIDRNLPLDTTLIDILNKSGVSTLKKLSDDMRSILERIEVIIGGKVIFENNRYYIERTNYANVNYSKIDFSVEAEGFKKLGLIYRLIETGNIAKGSVLIWDEPESNINPNNIPLIVDILLELQRNGVQIFLATHSYDVARWFELKAEKEDKLKYFNFKKTENGVECTATAKNYKSLEDSVIEDASDKLYNAVMFKINGEHKNG
jgi:predicted ATP-dependent endonuclease of OLD family